MPKRRRILQESGAELTDQPPVSPAYLEPDDEIFTIEVDNTTGAKVLWEWEKVDLSEGVGQTEFLPLFSNLLDFGIEFEPSTYFEYFLTGRKKLKKS